MGREERQALIREIEELRDSRVLVYFAGDRPLAGTQIADDVVRPMYDHLQNIDKISSSPRRLDLYLYSVGGVMETPWKIVTMLREFCDELHVVIPYKAYSSATLLAIGADKIWMTRKAELGPIDPSLTFEPSPDRPAPFLLRDLGVEDVASYVKFLRNRAGLTDQSALAGAIGTLAEQLTPTLLGRIERIYSHIRLVARKLLSLCQPPLDEAKVTSIVEALTEKSYIHGHGIGRKEAKEIGLPIEDLSGKSEELVWDLFKNYEESLNMNTSRDPNAYFTDSGPDSYEETAIDIAYIESMNLCHAFVVDFKLEKKRILPPSPTFNIHLNLNLPPGVNLAQLPADLQQILQQLVQQAQQQIQPIVVDEIKRQAPVEGIGGGTTRGKWTVVK